MRSTGARLVALCLLFAGASVAAVGPAQAGVSLTPVTTGCPAGYTVKRVTAMEASGPYYLPRLTDAAGNNNLLVCALAQPDSVRDAYCKIGGVVACELQRLGLPHYLFKDDISPALKGAA